MEASIVKQIQHLRSMSVEELRGRWRELYHEESRSRNKEYLFRRLCWRIQELRLGGLSDAAKARITELAPTEFVRARVPAGFQPPSPDARPVVTQTRATHDPRLPSPGTVITRRWRGRELRLLALDDGFELDGVRYASLTEAARAATGSHWNGKLFWGVTQRKRRT